MKRSTKFIVVVAAALFVGLSFTFGIKFEVKRQIAPTDVIYTTDILADGEEITKDKITTRQMPASSIPPNAILKEKDVLGKRVRHGYSIPPNSHLFSEVVVAENDMPNSSVLKLKEGEYAFPLLVDLETSLGNGILPDTRVDISFRTSIEDEMGEEKIIYGVIASNVRVTTVKDSNAGAVFKEGAEDKDKTESMSKLYTFAVPMELNNLLSQAVEIGEVRPVAKRAEDASEETTIEQNEIVDFIKNKTYVTKKSEDGE